MIALRTSIVDEIPHLRRYALRLAHDADAAEELVQDCVDSALRRASSVSSVSIPILL